MIGLLIEIGLIVSFGLFLIVLFQRFEKPQEGVVKYSLSVQLALVIGLVLIAGLIFLKSQMIYDLFGDSGSGGVFFGLLFVGLMAFASMRWNIQYNEYGIIYTDWFSAPCVFAWEEIQEIRSGKIDKNDFFVVVSKEKQCRINDAFLCVGVKEFLEMVQVYAPNCAIDEKIRSYYEF